MNNKAIISILGMVLISLNAFANADAIIKDEANSSFFNVPNITSILFGVFLIYSIIRLAGLFIRTREIRIYKKYGKAQYLKEINESWFERFKRTATNAVPLDREENILLNHDYDGIHELDNDLPPWWLWMFYISIIFSIAYFAYYHVFDYGMSSSEEWEYEMAVAKEEVEKYISTQSNLVDETNVTALTDEASLAKGKAIFNEWCAACHLETGAGSVGPNLTDEYWLHGKGIVNVFTTVKYGVPEKGMISWKTQMSPADIHKVSSYILTLEGTNPPNPKAPQGEYYGEGNPTNVELDSTAIEPDSLK